MKYFLTPLLAFTLLAPSAFASEVTGTLSTSLSSDATGTTTGTVVSPAPSTSTGGGSSGGGHTRSRRGPVIHGRSGGSLATTTIVIATTTSFVLGSSTYNFTRDLTGGDTGPDVVALQGVLMHATYLVIDAPTGYFGPLTRAAVVMYQAAHGLPLAGRVGPLTRAVLNAGQ